MIQRTRREAVTERLLLLAAWLFFALAACLIVSSPAWAQGVEYSSWVQLPGGGIISNPTVAVCSAGANTTTTPCSPLASIYSNQALTTPLTNPMTGDQYGNYSFWAAPGHYVVQVYKPGAATQVSDVVIPCDPSQSCAISGVSLPGGGSLSGSAGAVSIAAGGTNQNINLTPSGTGTTNIAGAMTLNGALSGTISGNPTLSGNPSFTGSPTVTGNGTSGVVPLPVIASQVYNVKAYGATGNGTTDDTAAIQAAQAAAGPARVFFPPGTYKVTSALTIPSNQRFELSPGASIDCAFSGTVCIELDGESSWRGFAGKLAGQVNVTVGGTFTNVIYVNGTAAQSGSVDIDGMAISAPSGTTINGNVIDICGQENGDFFKNILFFGGASGTFVGFHIDGACSGISASNGSGIVQNVEMSAGSPASANFTPFQFNQVNGGTYSWSIDSIYAEGVSGSNHGVLIGDATNAYSGTTYTLSNVHYEGNSTGAGIEVQAPTNVTIIGYQDSTSLTTGTWNELEISNPNGASNYGTLVAVNVANAASGGAAVHSINNSISGISVSASDIPLYTWHNPGWNATASPLFDQGLESTSYSTQSNCNSAASPAVCGSAAAGYVTMPVGASTLTVDTTAITANSRVFLSQTNQTGTCNGGIQSPIITAVAAGTSFTFAVGSAWATSPGCFQYWIVN